MNTVFVASSLFLKHNLRVMMQVLSFHHRPYKNKSILVDSSTCFNQ